MQCFPWSSLPASSLCSSPPTTSSVLSLCPADILSSFVYPSSFAFDPASLAVFIPLSFLSPPVGMSRSSLLAVSALLPGLFFLIELAPLLPFYPLGSAVWPVFSFLSFFFHLHTYIESEVKPGREGEREMRFSLSLQTGMKSWVFFVLF